MFFILSYFKYRYKTIRFLYHIQFAKKSKADLDKFYTGFMKQFKFFQVLLKIIHLFLEKNTL